MNPNTVYVAFYWGTAWYSKAVEWFTKDGPSHVAFVHWSEDWESWLQLGSEAGGQLYLPTRGLDIHTVVALPNIDIWKGLRANISLLGQPYDFAGLLGMSVVMVAWNWLKMKVKNPLQSSKAWFCSEYATKVLRDSGVKLEIDPGETDPGRLLHELLMQSAEGVDKAIFLTPPAVPVVQ